MLQMLGLDDVLVDIAIQGLSGNLLHHEPEKHGVAVVVVEFCVGWKLRRMLHDNLEKVLGSVPALRIAGHGGLRNIGIIEEPTAHARQLAEGDRIPVGDAGHVFADRIVEADLALIHELQDGSGDEGLGHAADPHMEVGSHGFAGGRVAHAKSSHIRKLSVLPNTDDGSRDRGFLHCLLNKLRERHVPQGRMGFHGAASNDCPDQKRQSNRQWRENPLVNATLRPICASGRSLPLFLHRRPSYRFSAAAPLGIYSCRGIVWRMGQPEVGCVCYRQGAPGAAPTREVAAYAGASPARDWADTSEKLVPSSASRHRKKSASGQKWTSSSANRMSAKCHKQTFY